MQPSARYALAASGGERWRSLAAVAVIHVLLGAALISGLKISAAARHDSATQLIDVPLSVPPPPPIVPPPPPPPKTAPAHHAASGAAPRAPTPAPPGGSPGPVKRAAPPVPAPPVVVNPVAAGGGKSSGTSSSLGTGSGGGSGGNGSGTGNGAGDGSGDDDGGTDLEQIAGSIRNSDYPPAARAARISGRVEFRFTVGVDGRVSRCVVTRSSGSAELDSTTCRLVTERFRYRPSTDSRGRPIPDEVEGEQVWSTGGG